MQAALTPRLHGHGARGLRPDRRPFRGGRVGPEGGHGASSSGVPLNTSRTIPRSRSVARYATLAPLNSPLRITLFSRSARATVASKFGVATAPRSGALTLVSLPDQLLDRARQSRLEVD